MCSSSADQMHTYFRLDGFMQYVHVLMPRQFNDNFIEVELSEDLFI